MSPSEWSLPAVHDVVSTAVPDRDMVVWNDTRRTYGEARDRTRGVIARSLRTGDPPPVDPADAVDVLRVIEAAARSARRASVEQVTWERDEGFAGG